MKSIVKTIVVTIIVLVAAFLLAACATSEPQPARGGGFHLADSYMQAVERDARTKGIDVVWINAPSRSLAKLDESGED